jgi:hypothetical protein
MWIFIKIQGRPKVSHLANFSYEWEVSVLNIGMSQLYALLCMKRGGSHFEQFLNSQKVIDSRCILANILVIVNQFLGHFN